MPRFATLLLALALSACASPLAITRESDRAQIQASLDRVSKATFDKDIDTYMSLIPEDFVLRDESGELISRETQRANILRDWSIIPKTIALQNTVDRIDFDGDTATVYTSQRWERLMLHRDGIGTDEVVTTQKHKELWRRTPKGWFGYDIEELGGEIIVNGKPYKP